MGKPSPPKPPDPKIVSAAQTTSNVNTASAEAALNAVNQVSPFGTVTYDQTGSVNIGGNNVPRYTQTTTLSPTEQALYDKQSGVTQQAYDAAGQTIGQAQSVLSSPFSLQNLPAMQGAPNTPQPHINYGGADPRFSIPEAGQIQTGVQTTQLPSSVADVGQQNRALNTQGVTTQLPGANDFGAERGRVEQALMSRFNEDIQRREADTISRLNAQGLQQGSEAYGTEMDTLNRARNDAFAQAVLAGGQEQSRLFNMASQARGQQFGEAVTQGQFGNTAQAQDFGQALARAGYGLQSGQAQFGQNLAAGQFGNQAQGQQFGQNAAGLDAYNQAAAQLTGQNQAAAGFGNTALAQQFQQALQGANLQNQTRQQAIAEQQIQRSQPINEVAALLGLGPGVQMPTGAPSFGISTQPTDVLGAYAMQQQALQNAYNQKMGAYNSLWSGLSGMGSAALLASDIRAKNIIRRVGQTKTGIPLYLYKYKSGGPEVVGVIAQELRQIMPNAVHDIGGVLHVDYLRVA